MSHSGVKHYVSRKTAQKACSVGISNFYSKSRLHRGKIHIIVMKNCKKPVDEKFCCTLPWRGGCVPFRVGKKVRDKHRARQPVIATDERYITAVRALLVWSDDERVPNFHVRLVLCRPLAICFKWKN